MASNPAAFTVTQYDALTPPLAGITETYIITGARGAVFSAWRKGDQVQTWGMSKGRKLRTPSASEREGILAAVRAFDNAAAILTPTEG